MNLIDEMRQDFDLYHDDRSSYRTKVSEISNLLGLKGTSELQADYLPTYFVGDYLSQRENMVLFGLNPGFNKKQNNLEESLKNQSWDQYKTFTCNFFRLFHQNGMRSRYYSRLSNLYAGLEKRILATSGEIYAYYQDHLINIDLVPYHSTTFQMTAKNLQGQTQYLMLRFENCLQFASVLRPRLIMVNGGPLFKMLMVGRTLAQIRDHEINTRTKLYLAKARGIPFALFNRMITQPASGVTNRQMQHDIPELIHATFGVV